MFGIFKKVGKREMKLEEVSNLLSQLRIPTSLVFTPTNLAAEQKKFYQSDTYNPQFTYRIVKNRNNEILQQLASVRAITDVDPRISNFYIKLIDEKADASDLMHAVGNNLRFTEIGVRRYKMPTPILFRNACRILRGRTSIYNTIEDKKDSRRLNFEEVKSLMEMMFEEFGLEGWSAAASMNIEKNGLKVGVKRKEILMDPNISKRPIDLKKSVVHELTHVIRSYNGELTGFEALARPNLPAYLDVEEGLASWNEEMMGVLKKSDLRTKAAKTWAIYLGREMTFRELFDAISAIMPRGEAFKTVYRVKRGMSDTSMPGIYPKDVAYFRGFRRVRKRCMNDESLYSKLFAGKISFSQVKWVDEGLIPKPKVVPTKKQFDKVFAKFGI